MSILQRFKRTEFRVPYSCQKCPLAARSSDFCSDNCLKGRGQRVRQYRTSHKPTCGQASSALLESAAARLGIVRRNRTLCNAQVLYVRSLVGNPCHLSRALSGSIPWSSLLAKPATVFTVFAASFSEPLLQRHDALCICCTT